MTATDDFAFDELDELASAYLDGEATDAEVARVENDAELMARVEQMRAVSEAVGRPATPANLRVKNAAIQAALGATNLGNAAVDRKAADDVTGKAPAQPTSPISSLDDAREQRGFLNSERLRSIVAIAAVFAIGLVAVTAVSRLWSSSQDETAATATSAVSATDDAADAVAADTADAVEDASDASSDVAADASDAVETRIAGNASSTDDAMEEEAAMVEEEAMEEAAMEEAAMVDEAMEDDATEQEPADAAMADDGDTDAKSADEGATDAEASLAQRFNQDQPNFIGDFASFNDLVTSDELNEAVAAPQLVLPATLADCELASVAGDDRAVLYIGTAAVDGEARILFIEPTDGVLTPLLAAQLVDGTCQLVEQTVVGG